MAPPFAAPPGGSARPPGGRQMSPFSRPQRPGAPPGGTYLGPPGKIPSRFFSASRPLQRPRAISVPNYQQAFGQKKSRCFRSGIFQLVKKPRRVSPPQRRNRVKLCSAGACTWRNIPLGLKVWLLCAWGAQKCAHQAAVPLSEKPSGFFDSLKDPAAKAAGSSYCPGITP